MIYFFSIINPADFRVQSHLYHVDQTTILKNRYNEPINKSKAASFQVVTY